MTSIQRWTRPDTAMAAAEFTVDTVRRHFDVAGGTAIAFRFVLQTINT
ncbi:hypothetical protein [Rhodococcus qingshengii]|nr:hypothetical protein [Rhodococcus qingshengii]MBS3693894.1 hypothetical protein [Rhodococcus qingshengii]